MEGRWDGVGAERWRCEQREASASLILSYRGWITLKDLTHSENKPKRTLES